MHPKDCLPFWEYNRDPKALATILARSLSILTRLRTDRDACRDTAIDTRRSHLEIFEGLPPETCSYFAGNFRGCDFRCLKFLKVGNPHDDMLGYEPELVAASMEEFAAQVRETFEVFDAPSTQRADLRLVQLARAVACLFEMFLTIHPFANGNGHIARLLVWAVFGRYDFWMDSWTVEPRLSDPDYGQALYEHRRQRREKLVQLILRHTRRAASPPVFNRDPKPAEQVAQHAGPTQPAAQEAPPSNES